jgi:hypothetical protein
MKKILFALIFLSSTLAYTQTNYKINSDGFPTGQDTPEGTACDAIRAYINSDHALWLSRLIRPIFGEEKNKKYEAFKEMMVEKSKESAKDPNFPKIKISKVYKARNLSKDGPESMAYAIFGITENQFVDIEVDSGKGKIQKLRYQVMLDKDGKWYFNPRPDLSPLMSMGLNDENQSTEEWKK